MSSNSGNKQINVSESAGAILNLVTTAKTPKERRTLATEIENDLTDQVSQNRIDFLKCLVRGDRVSASVAEGKLVNALNLRLFMRTQLTDELARFDKQQREALKLAKSATQAAANA